MEYQEFLTSKIKISENYGFKVDMGEINPKLKPHNKLMVKWLVEGGKRACFASFGGLMAGPYCALNKGRKGWGIELSPVYFLDGAQYCAQAATKKEAPSLFDFLEDEPKDNEDDLPDQLK